MRDRRYDRRSLTSVLFSMAIEGCRKLSMATETQCSRHPPHPTRKGYLLSPIPYLLSPICAARVPLPSGGAGRQALVGSAWHAPLPLLLQSPFARCPALYTVLLALVVACATWLFLRRICKNGFSMALDSHRQLSIAIETQCPSHTPHPTRKGYLLSPISYLLSPICAFALGAAVVMTAAPTANALFVLSVLKLLDWARERRLRDWVWFSFLMAGLLLCGLPYIGWVVAMLIIAPLLIAADRRTRPRTGGLMFLCLAPVVYAAGCWFLLSYLILDDPFFAWRFIGDLSFGPLPRAAMWTAAGAAAIAAVAAAVHKIGDRRLEIEDRRYKASCNTSNLPAEDIDIIVESDLMGNKERGTRNAAKPQRYLLSHISYLLSPICAPSQIAAAATVVAAAAIWFGALAAAALDWSLPWGASANIAPPNRNAVARHVKEITPWGRVFVCGYAGLGGQCSDPADNAMFEPCLDLHIGVLREAYTRQRLYLLVPKPERENALEPCEWRYGGIYDNGAQRLLFDQDFGPWRLYEVVSAEF